MKYQYNSEYIKTYCNNTSIETRNKFSDDVHIVVIGHLRHLTDLITFYKGIKNVIFVVDNTEDPQKVKLLHDNGFIVLINTIPSETGFGNINLQCSSTNIGINYLKSIDVNNMIRMRSDQIILQLHKFINNFKFDKIGFLSYIDLTNNSGHFNENVNALQKKLEIEHNKKIDNLSYNYVMDYCITGPVLSLEKMFNYHETTPIYAPAEHKLLMNYLSVTDLKFNNSYDYLRKHFYFILSTLTKHNIDFIMIKQNYNNWSVCLKQDAPDLYIF